MIIKPLQSCPEFIAGDNTILREILHPDKEKLELRYSLAHAYVDPGKTSWPHKLSTSEVYYVLEGEGIMHIGEEAEKVGPGDTIYIQPDSAQFIHNCGTTRLVFLCIVYPAWRKENEFTIDH